MKTIALLLCLLTLALVGCGSGSSEANVVGKWKGELKMPSLSKDDPMAKMAEGLMGMMAMNVEFKADHKFTLTMMGMPIEGDWAMSGNTVTLTPTTVMGLTPEEAKKKFKSSGSLSSSQDDPSKPIKLEMQSDGKTMKALDDNGKPGDSSKGELVFTKEG